MLKYISTRGQAPRLGFADTTLAGLANDGGLYVPEACPKIEPGEIANMGSQHYLEIAWRVMLPFVSDDLPSEDLIKLLKAAYRNFDVKDVAPLRQLEDNLYVLELFHGPTLAFKDVALQFLGLVFDYLLTKRNERVTIIGATSGDTGSAAIEAFRGKKNADIFIFHPHKRVSEVQRRQMTTVLEPNVFNIAVEGTFDDCQSLVKAMFNDAKFRADMKLSAINSINWARILAQVVYYIYAGARVFDKTKKPVSFCVPTGNFGNVYAGYVAQSMGLPVEKLLVATNRNDILHRFMTTGTMRMDGVHPTISPSMDIEISSNFERLLFDLFGRMPKAVEQTMAHFRKMGPFKLEAPVMEGLRQLFASGRMDDAQTLEVIRRTNEKYKYLIDPHTAVGLGVGQQYLLDNPKSVVVSLATAHPAKFPDAVKRATGITPELPERLADLYTRAEKYDVLPNDLAKVQDYVRKGCPRVSFYNALRPLLMRLDPEQAHRLTLAALAKGFGPRYAFDDPVLHTKVFGLDFKNPLGLAAGFDKDAEAIPALFNMGFGFVETGTVTPLPQGGNPKPRVFRDPGNKSVINRMGFPGKGLKNFAANVLRYRKKFGEGPGVLGVNIGVNKDAPSPVEDYKHGIQALANEADYITVNVSSPNTAGLRDLQRRNDLDRLLEILMEVRAGCAIRPPLLLKVAPDLDVPGRQDIAELALKHKIDGLIVSNTTISRPPQLMESLKAEKGGLSGQLLTQLSTDIISDFYRLTNSALPIVGVGGISSAEDAYAKIRAGASLVQVYTGLVFEGPALIARILEELAALLKRDGFVSVAVAVGAEHAAGNRPSKAVV